MRPSESTPQPTPRRRRQADRRPVLLAALRRAGRALSVDEVAEAIGTSVPTARFHLSMLVSAGLVERTARRSGSAGRPSWGYAAAPEPGPTPVAAPDGSAAYRELARALASGMDDAAGAGGAAAAAREAGRRWADASPPPVPSGGDPADAIASLAGALDTLGFNATAHPEAGEIVLRACPLVDVARDHRAVVCGVHLGLVERTAARIGGGLVVEGLEPFRSEEPLVCAVRLQMPT